MDEFDSVQNAPLYIAAENVKEVLCHSSFPCRVYCVYEQPHEILEGYSNSGYVLVNLAF